jgi:hypothetical protein
MTTSKSPAGANAVAPAGPAPICRVVLNGVPCTATGVYHTLVEDCVACRIQRGVLWCVGHAVCVQHAAKIRTGALRYEQERTAHAVVARMTGVLEAS